MRVDLLPSRYHQLRSLEKQIRGGVIILGLVGAAMITSLVAVKAQSRAYEMRIEYLNNVAGQYKVVNDSYVRISAAEKDSQARKERLLPLVEVKGRVLRALDGLRVEFPVGISLSGVSVPDSGPLAFRGTARSFEDVGRFMKWLSERADYEEVALRQVTRGEGQRIVFEVEAVREGGATVEVP